MTDSTDNARGPKFPADWRDRAHSFKGIFKLQAAWADGFNAARDQIRADLAPDPLADERVAALVEALKVYADPCDGNEHEPCGYEGSLCCKTARTALAALSPTPQDDPRVVALVEFFEWVIRHKASVLDGMSRREQGDFTEMLGNARAALAALSPTGGNDE